MPQRRGGARGATSTRRKFIRALVSSDHSAPSEIMDERAAYITRHFDFSLSVLEDVLRDLDAALLTLSGPDSGPGASVAAMEVSAAAALRDLATFYESFSSRLGGVLAIKQECFRLLLDKWDHVTAWMVALLQSRSRGQAMLFDAIGILGVLHAVINATEVDLYQEEILQLECTTDVIITALCKMDRRNTVYFTIGGGGDAECRIVRALVFLMQASDECRDKVILRIKGTKGKAIIRALVGRAEQVLNKHSSAKSPHRLAATLAILSMAIANLSFGCVDEFLHHHVYRKYARVLSSLIQCSVDDGISDSLVWDKYAGCIIGRLTFSLRAAVDAEVNPRGIVQQFLEGGTLRGTLDCLSQVSAVPADSLLAICDGLKGIIQYLPVRQVYTSAIATHGDEISKMLDASLKAAVAPDGEVFSVHQELKKALARGEIAAVYQREGANGGVSTCGNLTSTKERRCFRGSEDLRWVPCNVLLLRSMPK
ncbi:hypothetical protein FA13DRAFT_169571 [Coprinellus micaceus]|uniref:Uncharacterized protein n=1 Tax=Coprinellus micaceus TaxID=71717 RepID=A0A4Y7SH85_COPMI|nr:hypothetical protein FA13DRAFT_169571 [Coprinellus micaceus]